MPAKEINNKIEACLKRGLSESANKNKLSTLIGQLKLTELDKENRETILHLLCNELEITNSDNTKSKILGLRQLIIWTPDLLPTLFDIVSVLFPEAQNKLLKAIKSISFMDLAQNRTQSGWQLLASKSIPSLVSLLNVILTHQSAYKELVPSVLADPGLLKINGVKETIWPAIGRYYYESMSRLAPTSPLIKQFPNYLVKAVIDYISWTMLEGNRRATLMTISNHPNSALAQILAKNPDWQKTISLHNNKSSTISQSNTSDAENFTWVRATVTPQKTDSLQHKVHMGILLTESGSSSLFLNSKKENNSEPVIKGILREPNAPTKKLNVSFTLPGNYGLPPTEDELSAKLKRLILKNIKNPQNDSAIFENILIFFYHQIHDREKLQRIIEKAIENTPAEEKENLMSLLKRAQNSCKLTGQEAKSSPYPNEWANLLNPYLSPEKIQNGQELIKKIEACLTDAIEGKTDTINIRHSI
jgi:hypothetical protein